MGGHSLQSVSPIILILFLTNYMSLLWHFAIWQSHYDGQIPLNPLEFFFFFFLNAPSLTKTLTYIRLKGNKIALGVRNRDKWSAYHIGSDPTYACPTPIPCKNRYTCSHYTKFSLTKHDKKKSWDANITTQFTNYMCQVVIGLLITKY